MSLPNEIELPVAEDFCRGYFTKGNVRVKHCFAGWRRELFPTASQREIMRFNKVAIEVAMDMHLCKPEEFWFSTLPSTYNDDHRNTLEKLAEWFEKTVERFGYDVENDA